MRPSDTRGRVAPTLFGARPRAAIPWTCALLHVAAALWTASFLQNALHGVPAERLAFVEAHLGVWRAGWALWMFAASSFVAFIGWWAARVRGPMALTAFFAAVLGLAFDVAADSLYVWWLPARGVRVFEVGRLLSFVLAHLGYVLAGALLTFADRALLLPLRRVAWCIWALGAAGAVSALLEYTMLTDILFGSVFVFLVPWMVFVGRARQDGNTLCNP